MQGRNRKNRIILIILIVIIYRLAVSALVYNLLLDGWLSYLRLCTIRDHFFYQMVVISLYKKKEGKNIKSVSKAIYSKEYL